MFLQGLAFSAFFMNSLQQRAFFFIRELAYGTIMTSEIKVSEVFCLCEGLRWQAKIIIKRRTGRKIYPEAFLL